MDYSDLVDAVRIEGAAIVDVLGSGTDPEVPVPTCEHWTVAELVMHLGEFCGFWTHVLCEGTGRPRTPYPDPPDGPDRLDWLAELQGHLGAELEATPAATEVWTWFAADHTAGFVARRCAHELAVHRYDAEAVHGACEPIPTPLAVDGIDEILGPLVTVRDGTGEGSGRALVLRCTDAPVRWSIGLEAAGIDVGRATPDATSPTGDMTVAGTASDLELILYHRPALSPVDMSGDYTVLEEWYRTFTF